MYIPLLRSYLIWLQILCHGHICTCTSIVDWYIQYMEWLEFENTLKYSLPLHHMTAVYCVVISGMEQRFSWLYQDTPGPYWVSAVPAVWRESHHYWVQWLYHTVSTLTLSFPLTVSLIEFYHSTCVSDVDKCMTFVQSVGCQQWTDVEYTGPPLWGCPSPPLQWRYHGHMLQGLNSEPTYHV